MLVARDCPAVSSQVDAYWVAGVDAIAKDLVDGECVGYAQRSDMR